MSTQSNPSVKARKIAIESISLIFNQNSTAAETLLQDFSPIEIAISPIAAMDLYFRSEHYIQDALLRNDYRKLPVEKITQFVHVEMTQALIKLSSGTDNYLVPEKSGNHDYSLALQVYNDNKDISSLAMPKIYSALISNSNFKDFITRRIDGIISMEDAYSEAARKREEEKKMLEIKDKATRTALVTLRMVLPDEASVANILREFSDYEIAVLPVAALEIWYSAHRYVENRMSRVNFKKPPTPEALSKDVLAEITKDLPEILSAISEKVLPEPSANTNYELARSIYADDPTRAKSVMPTIINAILKNGAFPELIKSEIRLQIDMNETYRREHFKQDRLDKIKYALDYAADQRAKRLERNFVDYKALPPEVNALMNDLDFNLDQASLLLKDLDVIELSLVPALVTYVDLQTDAWVASLTVKDSEIQSAFISRPKLIMLEGRCRDNIASANITEVKSKTPREDLISKVLNEIIFSDAFEHEAQARLVARAKELNNLLPKNDVRHQEMYEVEIETSLVEDSAKALSTNALLLPAEKTIEGNQLTTQAAQTGFNYRHPVFLFGVVPALSLTAFCAFTFICARAESYKRMGSYFANAIKSGMTLIKPNRSHYQPVPVEENKDRVTLEEGRGVKKR